MRILGYVGRFGASYVRVAVIASKLGIQGSVEFLIDTGASRTTLSDEDAFSLGISYSKLVKLRQGLVGIGGTVDTYQLSDVEFIFRTETGSLHSEQFSEIFVTRHSQHSQRQARRTLVLPSLLGRDIIDRFTLVVSKPQRYVFLTDEQQ